MTKHRTKGKVLMTCEECKESNFFSRSELVRASRPRCSYCGSAFLIISDASKEKLTKHDDGKKMRKR